MIWFLTPCRGQHWVKKSRNHLIKKHLLSIIKLYFVNWDTKSILLGQCKSSLSLSPLKLLWIIKHNFFSYRVLSISSEKDSQPFAASVREGSRNAVQYCCNLGLSSYAERPCNAVLQQGWRILCNNRGVSKQLRNTVFLPSSFIKIRIRMDTHKLGLQTCVQMQAKVFAFYFS